MTNHPRSWLAAAALLLACALPAHAALTVDTGEPNGSAVGAFVFDSNDSFAAQVSFGAATDIRSISTHVIGTTAAETFTVLLYADSTDHLPGDTLFQSTATVVADGWNGVSNLVGWTVAAGNYWLAFEIGSADTLGSGSTTGALLDRGAPMPLARTAFNAGGRYQLSANPLDFGLRAETVLAVPEPAGFVLMLAALAGVGLVAQRRR